MLEPGGHTGAWQASKEAHLARLAQVGDRRALWLAVADELSDTTTLLAHVAIHGGRTWELSGGGRDGSSWYHRSMPDLVSALPGGSRLPARFAGWPRSRLGVLQRPGVRA